MSDAALDMVKQRLGRLERENQQWRRLRLLGLVAMATIVLAGAAQDRTSEVITARRFVAVGPTGQRQAELGVDQAGQPGVAIFDTAGRVRARLILTTSQPPDAPALLLFDKDAKLRAIFALNATGEPRVALRDGDGTIRAVLGYTTITGTTRSKGNEERPPSSLVLFDKAGDVIWKAPN